MKFRFLPDSLFGRLMSALLAVVVAAALLIAGLVARERQELAYQASGSARLVASISETSVGLAAMSPDQRAAEIARLQKESLPLDGSFWWWPQQQDPFAAALAFGTRLSRALGRGYQVDVRPPGPEDDNVILVRSELQSRPSLNVPRETRWPRPSREERRSGSPPSELTRRGPPPRLAGLVDVFVVLPDGHEVRFRTPIPPRTPGLPLRFLTDLGLLTAALGVVLYLMTRSITSPLRDLARAAESVGRGARHVVPEAGAREVREATRAFNVMQERLYRYLDSRTRVLAAMSHDLRTPLTRLRLRLESLDDVPLRERCTADLEEMNDMVTGALSVFRGLNGDEPTMAIDVVGMLEDLRSEFSEVGESVRVLGTAQPLLVKPKAFKRCVGNLISNAVLYGKRAMVQVEDGPSELVLRVLDDGPGIPQQVLEQVFEPFFRIEGSRNAATGGVGLGLSIARDIAQAHGGSLVLQNRQPHGLEAIVRVPRPSSAQSCAPAGDVDFG